MKIKKGSKLESWTVHRQIGQGGNSYVWKATNDDGVIGALKVPKPGKKRYDRFKGEVAIQTKLSGTKGVMPILDYRIPEKIDKSKCAWLVTPFAKRIDKKLADSPLEEVIQCVLDLARTLEDLAAKEVAHRDIKPHNIFWLDDEVVIGDFGLADFPDKEPLTELGERTGAIHVIAPEMLTDALNADPYRADVFSLAKTMWVLATGQKYPPGGQLRVDIDQVCLSNYVKHPKAPLLDRLGETATNYEPSERPSMSEFADELENWMTLQSDSPIAAGVSVKITPILSAFQKNLDRRQSNMAIAEELNKQLAERLQNMASEQKKLNIPATDVGYGNRISKVCLSDRLPKRDDGGPMEIIWANHNPYFSIPVPGEPVSLICGLGIVLFKDGSMHGVSALVMEESGRYRELWARYATATAGTSEFELAMNKIVDEMHENLGSGLDKFADAIANIKPK